MRCEVVTKKGAACTQQAMSDSRRCVSHAGLCGARPGNRNALRHGLYSHHLTPEEKLDLVAARAIEGVDEEIAVTRLMIVRALRQQDAPPQAYARLVEALCRQLRMRRQLSGQGADSLTAAIGTLIDEVGAGLGMTS
jgi:hypothetical protein